MLKLFIKVISIVLIMGLVYFGNKGVQKYLGYKALDAIEFEIHSLDDAKAKAKAEGKLVLADYSAIWCPSCRKLDEKVFANEEVSKTVASGFIYARVDYDSDEGKAFAAKHELVGFPRVIVLKDTGTKVLEMPLTFDPFEYQSNLNKVLAQM